VQPEEFRIEVRRAVAGDVAYLSSTWLRAFLSGRGRALFDMHRPVVAALLSRCGAWVAHPAGDPDTILGFLVAEDGIAHWMYVRAVWRGNGIARELWRAAGMGDAAVFTHWSDCAGPLSRRFKGLVYYPYLAEVGRSD
jgi:GNAT superfamily N-acetyltransferase